jgi:hypothetical protein
VDSSFIFVVNDGVTRWLVYPEYTQIGVGRKVTIVPTRTGLPPVARYWISEGIPKGLRFSTKTGALTGGSVVHDGIIFEPTIMAIGADGGPVPSTWVSVAVMKPAVPMTVTARPATRPVKPGKTAVVTKVKQPSYSRLSARVTCSHCSFTFKAATGKLVVKVAKGTKKVTVRIVGQPSGAKAKMAYAGHTWTRTWKVNA